MIPATRADLLSLPVLSAEASDDRDAGEQESGGRKGKSLVLIYINGDIFT